MSKSESYFVAGCRPWNREIFDTVLKRYPGEWHFIGMPGELHLQPVEKINPRYLFFLHWSWKVPLEIIERFECIGFHPTDLPFGRGGTPIQNLIIRGLQSTKLSAFRMTGEMDAGPIYLKEAFSLEGSAEQIYQRMNKIAAEMIQKIITKNPTPKPQEGEVVIFRRRKPEESQISNGASLRELYDFIRMLDAPEYPKAFIEKEGLRYEFSEAELFEDFLEARVIIHHPKSSK